MTKREIIDELYKNTGVKIKEDDPAFILVELNKIALRVSSNELTMQLNEASKQFNSSRIKQLNELIAVSNDAISKLIKHTNEFKESSSQLNLNQQNRNILPSKNKLLIPLIFFSVGLICGLLWTFYK